MGAGHILAEEFSERADLRQRLREILQRTGKIVSTRIGGEPNEAPSPRPSADCAAAHPAAGGRPAEPDAEPPGRAAETPASAH